MKKWFHVIVLSMWAFVMHAQSGGIDPTNPGDPQPYYSLNVVVSPSAGGTANLSHTMLREGQTVTVRASANEGFQLVQWVCGEEILSNRSSFTYTMPAHNVTLTAQMLFVEPEPEVFDPQSPPDPSAQEPAPPKHLVTIYTSPSVGGTVNNSSFYLQEGRQQSIYAYPNAGYEFVGWYVGDRLESATNPVTLTMGKNAVILTARFRFNPVSPKDPSVNYFDESTGTVIIDHFAPGYLSSAIYDKVGSNNISKIKSLTVVGEMKSDDYGAIYNSNSIETIDFSRTTGYTNVPSWAFENFGSLRRVVLPVTVENIDNYAFYQCTSLQELVLYSLAPPQAAGSVLYGVSENLVVYVPAASLPLYQAHAFWSKYTIVPIDLQTLNVSIDEQQLGKYENMFLELLDTQSGQLRRYVITKRNNYSFSGIFDESTYQLSLRNAQGKVFGQEMVTFLGKDTTIKFTSLKQPVNLSVSVQNAEGLDLTEHVGITWFDGNRQYLSKGTTLKGQVEGEIVYYQAALDETIGIWYQQPDSAIRVVADTLNAASVETLSLLPQKTLVATVADSATRRPISGASVVVMQKANNKYNKIFNATTASDGSFTLSVIDAPFDMSVSASDYRKKTLHHDELSEQILLSELSGAYITYDFEYIAAIKEGETPVVQNWYDDYANINFSIENTTQNRTVEHFEVQYPRITLLEPVDDGDQLLITATGRTDKFMQVGVTTTVANQSAKATFTLTQLGQVHATYAGSENQSVVGSLYDEKGKLVKTQSFIGNDLSITDLTDGRYTLVVMGKSTMFNTIYDKSNFAATGLVENTDYVTRSVAVESGKISTVSMDTIPLLDESKFYYTGNGTSYTVNKSSIVIGNYLTLTARVDFKSEYASAVSNVQLLMDVPEGCSFVENSVMVGNSVSGYTFSGSRLTVPIDLASGRVRFCVIPTQSGTFAPNAYVQFELNGKTITQPIGAAHFTAEALSISVPSIVSQPKIMVSGMTPAFSEIDVFDNNKLIGHTTALASGKWSVECELANAYNLTTHSIYAKAKNANLELLSETQNCFYNISNNEIKTVTMTHYNGWYKKNMDVVFDMEKGTTTPSSYYYYTSAEFSFIVDFQNNDTTVVSDVSVYAHGHNGAVTKMQAVYDIDTDKWVAKHFFTSENAPVNVSVEYENKITDLKIDARQIIDGISELMEDFTEYNNILNSLAQLFEGQMTEDEILAFEQLSGITLYDFRNDSIALPEDSLMANMTDEELEAYLDAMYEKYVHEDDSIFSELHIIENNLTFSPTDTIAFEGGLTYELRTCDGITQEQLLSLGYREYPLTDGTFVYFLSSDTIHSFVNFAQNTYLVIRVPADSDANMAPIRTFNSADFWKAVDGFLKCYSIVTSTINAVWDELIVKSRIPEELLKKSGDDIEKRLKRVTEWKVRSTKKEKIIKWEFEEKRLQRELAATKLAQRITNKLCKRLIQCLPVVDYLSTLRTCYATSDAIISTFKSIPDPCKDDQTMANACKASCVSLEIALGSKAIADVLGNFTADAEIVSGALASVATAGTSLAATAWGLVQKLAVQLGSPLIDLGLDYGLDNVKQQINNLQCNHSDDDDDDDEEDCDKPGYPPCPCKGQGCGRSGGSKSSGGGSHPKPKTPSVSINWDPAGFVYEAVEDNRIEGVKATVYYKDTHENMFGEMVDEEVVWDASEYDQENPLYTDANGEYQWFVPQGLWQVRFEKEGYEPTESDWLPVPPPQLEVNIPIVQLRQPEVANAIAHKDAIDITFDKYMMPSLLNTDNIFVTANDQTIAGTIVMLDEQHPYDNTETSYASKVRFVPVTPFTASEITLTVSNRVRSYADVPMAQPFQQVFDIEDVDHLQSAATPTASVSSGTEVSPYTEVYLTCSTDRATIRYTIDGTTPDCNTGILYTGHPIMLTSTNAIIRAIACADGFDPSEVATFTYVISTGTHISACGTEGHAHVNVKGGILHVEGLTSPAQVYSAQGMLLMTVTNGTYRLPAGGMYLIRHDKGVKKIVF